MTTSSNPTLLVPVALEALVVNNYVQDEIPFTLWSPSYENLNQFIPVFPDPVFPGPNTQTNPAKRGVHLHWVLPDAFTNEFRTSGTTTGVNNSQQTNAFPLVPNRWLVARIVPGTSTTTGTCKAWMIQSDYYDPNPNGTTGTSPYLNPFPTTPGAIVQTTLGQKHDLESWVEPNPAQLFLQAIGPANITFAAYTHNVENVFAFVDDLSDLPNANSGVNLTYVVMGWYSNPTEDLIHGWTTAEDWEKLMQKLNWAIPAGLDNNSPVESLPKQSLCQGMIYDVQWQTNTLPNNPGQGANADPNKMSVAVGNKGIDAFTALLESVAQNSGKTINPELMEAFQYNLLPELDQPDGAAQIDLKVQQAWFGSTPGGILWQIVSAQRADLTKTDQPQSQPTPAQEAKLATLNQAQVQLDQDRRRLQSLQQQLYDIWWKNGNANIQGTPSEVGFQQSPSLWTSITTDITNALDSTQPHSLINQVTNLQTSIATQAANLPDPHNPQSISNYATTVLGLPPTLQLNFVTQPRFYQPSDPVLMIGGIEWPDRYLYGGQSDPNAALPTRLGNQTITGLTVGNQTVTVSEMNQYIPMISSIGQSKLPAALQDLIIALLQEAFLMDTESAAVIAAHVNGLTPAQVQTAISQKQQTPTANLPAPLSVTAWQQAWSPLFLDWEVTWLPTVQSSGPSDNPVIKPDLVDWQFDGTDYNWTGSNSTPTDPLLQTYKSRIFLSPHITFGFIARLKQYLKDNPNGLDSPDLQAIEALIEQVGEWNFLSQALSGLNDFLIMRKLDGMMVPDSTVSKQIDNHYDSYPYPDLGAWTDPDTSPYPAYYFFPTRAGHFCFTGLQVVDRFGQVVNLLKANNNTNPNLQEWFFPIQGKGLAPESNFSPWQGPNCPTNPKSYLKQAPRLLQPSRLEFNFVSATNDQQQSDLYVDANPVCGWVLPNHLDNSLAIYDATGKLLGELLLLVNNQGQQTLNWQPDPGDPAPVAPGQILNPHLKGFVQQLLALNDQGKGFEALLQVIDATLWKVDPLGGRGDQNLSVLIGRPLALVRAKLQLMLAGDPMQDQSWSMTLGKNWYQETTYDFTQNQFDVRLGSLELFDDGLLGYFNSDNYGQFNSVHSPTSSTPYITPIGQNNYITLPPNYLNQPPAQQTTKFVTMLLDPRGNIHATTGILPTLTVTLPDDYIGDTLKNLNVTFRVNGLLTDPSTIRIPVPSVKNGDWSWIERSAPQSWNTTLPIVKANQKPRLANIPPVIHEGWLKLIDREESST